MSEHITADLGSHSHDIEDFQRVLDHVGDASAPLNRWRQLLQSVSPRGWSAVKEYAADVMKRIAQPRVLFTAAVALRAPGPKAPGPNKLRLEWLTGEELWEMCTVLGKAIDSGTYRPGKERVHWVQKMSGNGKRPIVLSDVQDRVVQKAAALVLRSMLDPLFDPLSFAFRPFRRREQAIAVAEKLATGGYPVWLTHDLKDAFCRVPLSRLLDVVFKLLPCPRLRAFLGRILPPQSPRLRGIKQGGPLSPLMLELYLTHFLHLPWRKAGHDVRIVRYADDLLLAVADHEMAAAVDAVLRKLLTPAGMLLKAKYEEAVLLLHLGRRLLPFVDHRLCVRANLLHLTQNRGRIAIGIEAFAGALHGFVFVALTDRAAKIFCFVLKHGAGPLVRIQKLSRITRTAPRGRGRDR